MNTTLILAQSLAENRFQRFHAREEVVLRRRQLRTFVIVDGRAHQVQQQGGRVRKDLAGGRLDALYGRVQHGHCLGFTGAHATFRSATDHEARKRQAMPAL